MWLRRVWQYLKCATSRQSVPHPIIEVDLYPTVAQWDLMETAEIQRSVGSVGSVFFSSHSTVYYGTMRLDGNQRVDIAIKEFRLPISAADSVDRNTMLQRFYMEVLIWSQLQSHHPNIAQFRGFTSPLNDQPTIVSTLYQNGGLDEYLRRGATPNLLLLLRGVASAVQYLHSKGIVHGDIKPANVLIDDSGEGRLCDFGSSHFIDSLAVDVPGSIEFLWEDLEYTLSFTSPELLQNKLSTTMSDVWALGCLAMQIFTEEKPYGWLDSKNNVKRAIRSGVAPFAPRTDLDKNLTRIISACWNRDPVRRPSSTDFFNQIDTFIKQNPDCDGRSGSSAFL